MTPEEQIAALEEATDYLDKKIAVGNTIYCPDMARDILAPMFAKIAALEAENAALRKRLVVDDAMVQRAQRAWADGCWALDPNAYNLMCAALKAALANKDDANG